MDVVESMSTRGQYSISSVRGIPADIVSGSIDNTRKKRRTTGALPVVRVHLLNVTKREITVLIGDRELALSREDALRLSSMIQSAFG